MIREIKREEMIICTNCKSIFEAKDEPPTAIIENKCPKCRSTKLFWAAKEKNKMEE